jgi:hypothetical protein
MKYIIPTVIVKDYKREDNIILQYPQEHPYYNYYVIGTFYKKLYVTQTNMEYYLILINRDKKKYIYIIRTDNKSMSIEEFSIFDMEIKTIDILININSIKK